MPAEGEEGGGEVELGATFGVVPGTSQTQASLTGDTETSGLSAAIFSPWRKPNKVAPALPSATTESSNSDKVSTLTDGDYPHGEADVVTAIKASELTFSEMVRVVQATQDTEFAFDMNACEQLFDLIDSDDTGSFDIEQLLEGVQKPEVRQYIRKCKQPVLKGFLSKNTNSIRASFKKIAQGDHSISKAEWSAFMDTMKQARITYFKRRQLVKGAVYFGKGMDPSEGHWAFPVQYLGFPRGLLEDFAYFAQNNHPLCVMCFSDPEHPFDSRERRVDFFSAFMMTFLGTGLAILAGGGDPVLTYIFTLVFATIPSMFIHKVAFYMLGCPCLVHDESAASSEFHLFVSCLESCGSCAKWQLVLIGFVAFILGIVIWVGLGAQELWLWCTSILQTWAMWFLIFGFVQFHPYSITAMLFRPLKTLTCGFLFVGKWRHEREMFLASVRNKMKDLPAGALITHPVAGNIPGDEP